MAILKPVSKLPLHCQSQHPRIWASLSFSIVCDTLFFLSLHLSPLLFWMMMSIVCVKWNPTLCLCLNNLICSTRFFWLSILLILSQVYHFLSLFLCLSQFMNIIFIFHLHTFYDSMNVMRDVRYSLCFYRNMWALYLKYGAKCRHRDKSWEEMNVKAFFRQSDT